MDRLQQRKDESMIARHETTRGQDGHLVAAFRATARRASISWRQDGRAVAARREVLRALRRVHRGEHGSRAARRRRARRMGSHARAASAAAGLDETRRAHAARSRRACRSSASFARTSARAATTSRRRPTRSSARRFASASRTSCTPTSRTGCRSMATASTPSRSRIRPRRMRAVWRVADGVISRSPTKTSERRRPSRRPAATGPLASDEPSCPKCGGRMWDNRLSKRNPKAPTTSAGRVLRRRHLAGAESGATTANGRDQRRGRTGCSSDGTVLHRHERNSVLVVLARRCRVATGPRSKVERWPVWLWAMAVHPTVRRTSCPLIPWITFWSDAANELPTVYGFSRTCLGGLGGRSLGCRTPVGQ